jgi:predicted negative regulator of RcsB-dependent stress response
MITQKFAKLQFEFGDLENGKTILEQMLKVHAKRADIWGVYGDLLLKFGDGEDARRVLLRGIEGCSKSRGRYCISILSKK